MEEGLAIFFGFVIFCFGGYFLFERQRSKKQQIENDMRGQNLHKMGLLSEVWHIMYLKNESPVIHAFEYSPAVGFDAIYEFWTRLAEEYLTFRSIPYKPPNSNEWYWKELPLNSIDFKQNHIKQVEISAKNYINYNNYHAETTTNNIENNECNIERALTHFVNSLNMNSKWDPKVPHWTIYYVTFKEEHLKNEAFGYLKIHHAMGDGVLFAKLLEYHHLKLEEERLAKINKNTNKNNTNTNNNASVTTTKTAQRKDENNNTNNKNNENDEEPQEPPARPLRRRSSISLLTNIEDDMSKSILSQTSQSSQKRSKTRKKHRPSKLERTLRLISLIPWTIYDFFIQFLILDSAPTATPISIGYCQHKHRFDNNLGFAYQCNMSMSKPLPLNLIKKLSKHYNGTINDVVVTLFCHAVNTFIKIETNSLNNNNNSDISNKNAGMSDKRGKNGSFWSILSKMYGKDFYIRFVSVFNVRSLLSNDLERLMVDFSKGNFDNEITMIPLRLPIGDMSFMERFKKVNDNFNRMKNGPMPIVGQYVLKLANFVGGVNLVMKLLETTATKCNILLSNLAGPRVQLPFVTEGGKNSINVWNMCNVTHPSNLPIQCGVMSYVDKITFSIAADINTMRTPDLLVDCIHQEFRNIVKEYETETGEKLNIDGIF